jgi:hypothetical protein
VSVGQSVVPNLGAQKRALQASSNGVPNFSTGRRGFHVTAPRLALLRSKSRRRRAPRPAAGPPTHAIAGTRARAVTMATVRPPSLPESLQAAGNLLCATTLSSLDAAVVTRRRHRVTYFAFPSGGAPAGASLHLRLPLRRRRPRRRVRRLHLRHRLRRLRPAIPASSANCAPRRATGLPTPIATTAAPARSSARPRADGIVQMCIVTSGVLVR